MGRIWKKNETVTGTQSFFFVISSTPIDCNFYRLWSRSVMNQFWKFIKKVCIIHLQSRKKSYISIECNKIDAKTERMVIAWFAFTSVQQKNIMQTDSSSKYWDYKRYMLRCMSDKWAEIIYWSCWLVGSSSYFFYHFFLVMNICGL